MYQMLTLAGRLGNEPELRYTPNGTPVCTFSVATDRRWTNDQGVKQEETTWHRVSVWRKPAENCAQYLHKGSMVLVTGHVKAHGYTNRDGLIAASLEVTADEVRFLSGQNPNSSAASSATGEAKDTAAGETTGGGDIPF